METAIGVEDAGSMEGNVNMDGAAGSEEGIQLSGQCEVA